VNSYRLGEFMTVIASQRVQLRWPDDRLREAIQSTRFRQ